MDLKWRRSRFWCNHAQQQEDGSRICERGLCALPILIECCVECPAYEGRDRGLGDTIKRAASALGIEPCGQCQKRREALNRMTSKLYGADDHGTD